MPTDKDGIWLMLGSMTLLDGTCEAGVATRRYFLPQK